MALGCPIEQVFDVQEGGEVVRQVRIDPVRLLRVQLPTLDAEAHRLIMDPIPGGIALLAAARPSQLPRTAAVSRATARRRALTRAARRSAGIGEWPGRARRARSERASGGDGCARAGCRFRGPRPR